jgi:hypothetical protein
VVAIQRGYSLMRIRLWIQDTAAQSSLRHEDFHPYDVDYRTPCGSYTKN